MSLIDNSNDNNKRFESISILIAAFLTIKNPILFQVVLFYTLIVSDYLIYYVMNLFLRKIKDTDSIRNVFDNTIITINISKYIFMIYLLILCIG